MEGSKPTPIPSKSSPRKRGKPAESRPKRISSKPRPQSEMAMSCPQPRFHHSWPWNQHYGKDTWPWDRASSASPKKRDGRASSDSAANSRMTCSMYAVERPNSSRICYESGVFGSSLHSAKRDFFVIHPEWASEEGTMKKITATDRKPRQLVISAPSRRCRSAPPPKYRNPITWK